MLSRGFQCVDAVSVEMNIALGEGDADAAAFRVRLTSAVVR